MKWTLVIRGDPCGEASPNRLKGRHYRVAKGLHEKHGLLAHDAWNWAGCPVATKPVKIHFQVFRGRTLDYGNALAACEKGIVDGLKGRMFKDDGMKWVRELTLSFETGKVWKGREFMRVVVEEVAE